MAFYVGEKYATTDFETGFFSDLVSFLLEIFENSVLVCKSIFADMERVSGGRMNQGPPLTFAWVIRTYAPLAHCVFDRPPVRTLAHLVI